MQRKKSVWGLEFPQCPAIPQGTHWRCYCQNPPYKLMKWEAHRKINSMTTAPMSPQKPILFDASLLSLDHQYIRGIRTHVRCGQKGQDLPVFMGNSESPSLHGARCSCQKIWKLQQIQKIWQTGLVDRSRMPHKQAVITASVFALPEMLFLWLSNVRETQEETYALTLYCTSMTDIHSLTLHEISTPAIKG